MMMKKVSKVLQRIHIVARDGGAINEPQYLAHESCAKDCVVTRSAIEDQAVPTADAYVGSKQASIHDDRVPFNGIPISILVPDAAACAGSIRDKITDAIFLDCSRIHILGANAICGSVAAA
ncbi:hypothetical protein CSC75_14165 [Pseudoxanthomonas wuyuanensis]|nr:hypothetical protein CSC75_14165 [Pseudoxanthomonas wuyuanensis]